MHCSTVRSMKSGKRSFKQHPIFSFRSYRLICYRWTFCCSLFLTAQQSLLWKLPASFRLRNNLSVLCFRRHRRFLPRDARSSQRGIAIVSRPSVRPSVCPSVTLMYREHTGWTSSKLITRIISSSEPINQSINQSANFKPKRTVAASRGFLATARLSCFGLVAAHLYHGLQCVCPCPAVAVTAVGANFEQ